MQHFINCTLPLFGFGFLGILIMAFIKMNDISKRSDTYTFGNVFPRFIRREWPSYGLSLIVILITALTHDEWINIFVQKFSESFGIPVGIHLAMVLWGLAGQYLIYKKLGKLAKQPLP